MIFSCPGCATRLQVPDLMAGTVVACPHCHQQVVVPVTSPLAGAFSSAPLPAVPAAPAAQPTAPPTDWSREPEEDYQEDHYERRPGRRRNEALSQAGQVCSILSIIFGAVAFLFCPLLFGLAGFVLGIVGTVLSENKAPGVIGIILSVVGTIGGVILGIITASLFDPSHW